MYDISKRLKEIELAILKVFIDICNKNQLQYYLLGGSCLGAIRHQGFIPWDDDIDVGLPRKDYNKLMKIGNAILPEYYFLQNYKTDPEFRVCYAKIRDSRTTFIETSSKRSRINHGVYIDVFPLDYYPENGIKSFKAKDLILKARISAEFDAKFSKKRKFLQELTKIIYPDVTKAVLQRDDLIQSIENSRLIANFCGAWGDREIMPIEWFDKGKVVQFENIRAVVPLHYHDYLSKIYGNYMSPPPADKQIGHHYTEIIDLDKPYTDYLLS